MREILFRGKRLSDGEWVTGYYIQPTYHWHKRGIHKDWIACGAVSNGGWLNLLQKYAVIPETVGQFTGLIDKNGKKIFEGDVVLYPWNDQDKPERFAIKFKDGQFVASPIKETEDYWDFMVGGYSKEMEIIGNIHDNPELLEVK